MTDLPQGWEYVRLGEIATWGSGGTPRSGDPAYYGGSIPWAVIGDLNNATISATVSSITREGLANSSAKLVPKDTILIAMYGSIGKMAITGIEMATNQAIAFAIPHEEIVDRKFLFWYLRSQEQNFLRAGKGATQQNISQTLLKSWLAPLPPLAEQRRIVAALEDHLSRLGKAVAALTGVRSRIARLEDKLFTSAFNGVLHEHSADALTPPPTPSETIDESLPSVPSHWQWTRLDEVAEVVGGITKGQKNHDGAALVEVPYLRVANVQRGRLDLSKVARIRVTPKKLAQLELRVGDVLLNEGGDRDKLGRGWVWDGQIEGCIHQNHVFRARIRDNRLDPRLLAWYANGPGRRWFEANGRQTVNLASISLSKISLLPVPVPPKTEQLRMVEALDSHLTALRRSENLLATCVARAEALRRALLTEAFAGRLVEQDAAEEPASELLRRIRVERGKVGAGRRTRRARPVQEELL